MNNRNDMRNWCNRTGDAWDWAMSWVEESKSGTHYGVKMIMETAEKYKEQYCTDGMWSAGCDVVYDILREAADMAQAEYEDACPPME